MKEIENTLKAIKKSLIVLVPLIMVGSFVIIFRDFPNAKYQEFITSFLHGGFIKLTNNIIDVTLGEFSLYLAIAIGYFYAKQFSKEIPHAYIMMIVTTSVFLIMGIDSKSGSMMDIKSWGIENSFASVIVASIAAFAFKKVYSIRILRLEKSLYGINTVLKDSYGYIIPCTTVMVLSALINTVIQNVFNCGSVFSVLSKFPENVFYKMSGNTIFAVIYILMVTAFSFIGIRGQNVMLLVCNTVFANTAGLFNESYFNTFVFMGGSGATISLVIGIIMFSKRQSTKGLNNINFIANIFNINDMMMFGLPIVGSKIFAVPFIIVPFVNFIITTVVMNLGIVPPVVNSTSWITPVIFSGYITTGSIRASILQVINIVIGVAIYRPFIKKNDEQVLLQTKNGIIKLQNELQEYESLGKPSDFLTRKDEIGDMAQILCRDLDYSLAHNELKLVYQPQVTVNGKCIGAEALLRWNHKIAGNIYPPLIIAIAKESGKLSELEHFIFNQACKDLKYIHKYILPYAKVSVNITGDSLFDENLEHVIEDAVKKYNVDGSKLWIEITEQDAIAMTPEITERLLRLQNRGHKLLIDDFGMGHTSLTYLQNNKFDVVKLDGSITMDVLENSRSCQIISSIAYLAQNMGFSIIAEYVETEEQRDKLQELHCDAFQGYLYSKPLDINEFEQWIGIRSSGLQK